MKILLVTFGSFGDVYPFTWMAKALKKAGYQPVVISNSYFKSVVEEMGIEFIGLGTNAEYDELFSFVDDSSDHNNPVKMIQNVKSFIKGMILKPIEETVRIISDIQATDAIIINSMLAFGAGLASIRHSLKQITVALAPTVISNLRKDSNRWGHIPTEIAKRLNESAFRMMYGHSIEDAAEQLNIQLSNPSGPDWIFENGTLCLFPNWFVDFALDPSKRISFIGFPEIRTDRKLPDDFCEFLMNHKDPIVFTPGTPFRNNSRFFKEAVTSLHRLERPGIFLTRNLDSVPGNLPSSIYVSEFLPLGQILHHCSLIVHHGGIGTTSQAARSGIPQIVFYHQGLDQKKNATIMEREGTAKKAAYKKLNSRLIYEFATGLLSQATKSRCIDIKERIESHSSERALIEFITEL